MQQHENQQNQHILFRFFFKLFLMSLHFPEIVSNLVNEYKICAQKLRNAKSKLKKKNDRIFSLETELRNSNYTLELYIAKFGVFKEEDDDETRSDRDAETRMSSQEL